MTARTVDELLLKYGDPGRFQVAVYCMLWIAMCTLAFNNFMGLFTVIYYPHHCKLPTDWRWPLNQSIPVAPSGELDSCSMYKNPENLTQGTTKCLYGWVHKPPGHEWTIVQEWDLVCDRQYLGPLSTSLYFTGIMVGCLIFGFLSDKFGRRPILLATMYAQIVVATALAFANSYGMYVGLRIFHGTLLQGCYSAAFTMSVEIFQPHHRNAVAIASQCLWPTMLCLITLFSYLFGDWRTLHLVTGLPGLVTIFYVWLLPESVRWLLVAERLIRAEKEVRRMAKFNAILVPANLTNNLKLVSHSILANRTVAGCQQYGLRDLFKGSKMRLVVFSSWFCRLSTMIMYWGVSYAMPSTGMGFHLNFFISGLLEVIFSIAMFWVMQKVGRRKICISFMGVCAVLHLVAAILRAGLPADVSWVQILLALQASLGRTVIGLFFCCLPMYTNELFPTAVRTLASGMTSFFGRLGSTVAPYFVLMEQNVWAPLPFLVYTALAGATIVILFFLPETLNKSLPEIPEDVGKLWAKQCASAAPNRLRRQSVGSFHRGDSTRSTNGVRREKLPEHALAEIVALKSRESGSV